MNYEQMIERNKQNFAYHNLNSDQAKKVDRVRESLRIIADTLVTDCPESRELSLALTKLEEVMFWANAAIARN